MQGYLPVCEEKTPVAKLDFIVGKTPQLVENIVNKPKNWGIVIKILTCFLLL